LPFLRWHRGQADDAPGIPAHPRIMIICDIFPGRMTAEGAYSPPRVMHIFALETDLEKIKLSIMGRREEEVMMVTRHRLPFVFACLREALLACVLVAAWWMAGMNITVGAILLGGWLLWAVFAVLRAYIDQRFSFLFLTREKVVIVRQHLLHRQLLPITLNNVQSVEVVSQYWDLFGFGRIHIHLRESGEVLTFSYVPESSRVAKKMTNIVSMYNQRIGLEHMERPPPPVMP
jgi:hypothetical protein